VSKASSAFVPDRPEALEAGADVFGHSDYADALAKSLTEAEPPFTMGIFGEWGVGKSTIIAAIRERLPDDCAFAFFDAWRYEGDAIRRQFLLDVARQLEAAGELNGFSIQGNLSDLDVDVTTEEPELGFSKPHLIRSVFAAAVLGLLVFALLRWKETAGLFTGPSAGTDAMASLLIAVFIAFASLLVQPFAIRQRVLNARRLDEPDQFTRRFEELMGALKPSRLVVAIDNLDRCSPKHAVEVLSTIKTYLEPSLERQPQRRLIARLFGERPPKEAVFLIAVDDKALKRHLVSQEAANSPGQSLGEAQGYVDEYLRKFFTATVPIKDLLDEDMRRYVASHIGRVLDVRGDPAQRSQLVEMTAAALRGNPRRIKQFTNNLELRLRLIEARERKDDSGKAKMFPPISGELLMVAKLLLVEEQWPDLFDRLQHQPRLLSDWEQLARSGEAPVEGSGAGDLGPSEWENFAAFLRVSSAIQTRNLRAFLRLKQSEEEVALLDYADFYEAVVGGRIETVQSIVSSASVDVRPDYAGRLLPIFRDQLREQWLAGAVSVVNAAISVEAFAGQPAEITAVLAAAISEPQLHAGLTNLDPHAALAAGARLEGSARQTMSGLFAGRFSAEIPTSEEPMLVAEALAAHIDLLSAAARRTITEGIEKSPDRFGAYLPLARADGSLLPAAAVDKAVELVAASAAVPLYDDENVWAVLHIALGARSLSTESADRLLAHLGAVFTPQVLADSAELGVVLDQTAELAGGLEGSATAHTTLAQHVNSLGAQVQPDMKERVLRFTADVITNADENMRAGLASDAVAQVFAADPAQALALVTEHAADLPVAVTPALIERITQVGQENASLMAAASDALVALEPNDISDRLLSIATQATGRGEYDGVRALLGSHGSFLAERQSEIAASVLTAAAAADPSVRTAPLTLVAMLVRHLTQEQLQSLHDLVRAQLAGPDALVIAGGVEVASRLVGAAEYADLAPALVEAAFGVLEPLSQASSEHGPLIEFVGRNLELLTDGPRGQFIWRVGSWLTAGPEMRTDLSHRIQEFEGLSAEQRRDLVGNLISAVRDGASPADGRVELLLAAHRITGRSNSRAARALDAYLDELKQSETDEDRWVAEQVEETRVGSALSRR
jgi:hypothetical protein